jgi:hypothetical protein
MDFGWKLAIALSIAVLCAAIGAYAGYRFEANASDARMATHLAADRAAEAKAQEKARGQENELAAAQAKISSEYERGKKDAEDAQNRTIASLNAGTLRLQSRWSACEASRVSNAAGAASELDAITRDRNESAARIIGYAAACDKQVTGLQDLLISERSIH